MFFQKIKGLFCWQNLILGVFDINEEKNEEENENKEKNEKKNENKEKMNKIIEILSDSDEKN